MTTTDIRGYSPCTPAKSGVGICNPDIYKGDTRRASVFFDVVCIATFALWRAGRGGVIRAGFLCSRYCKPCQFATL
ncbi:hypothetical protein AAA67_002904 [Salmonella enterica subsp. diarizonae]|nr:hypothetical protein [Salmonella enterica subsp. diarizonae]